MSTTKASRQGGMKRFVENKNVITTLAPQSDRTSHNLNIFKVDVNGNAPAANSSLKRENVIQEVREIHPTTFDTDASAADATSNGGSTGEKHQSRRHVQQLADDLSQTSTGSDTSEEPKANGGGKDSPEYDLSSITADCSRLDKALRESRNDQSLISRYLPGDSYPTTSSERLSHGALSRMERDQYMNTRGETYGYTKVRSSVEAWQQGNNPHFSVTRRPSSPPLSDREKQHHSPLNPFLTQRQNRKSGSVDYIEQQSPGYTRPDNVAVNPGRARRIHRKPKKTEEGDNDWLSNSAQPGQLHSTSRVDAERAVAACSSGSPAEQASPTEDQIDNGSIIAERLSLTPKASDAVTRPWCEQHRKPSPDLFHDVQGNISEAIDTEGFANGEKDKLMDYDMETLCTMDYNAIKSANFDKDPRVEQLTLPGVSGDATLADQMVAASRLSSKSQAEFFATLDVETWEDAGEWFVDRFGEILSRFKSARQKKRQRARAFEDEIDNRHMAVTRRVKLTDSVLAGMKESGGKVLECTPKRAGSGKRLRG